MLSRPLVLAALALTVSASALAFAPHPSVLTVKYKDEMLAVTHMIGTDPVVLVDGREKRIRTEPSYLLQPAPAYGPSTVEFAKLSLGGLEVVPGYSPHDAEVAPSLGKRYGMTYFECTLKAPKTLKGAFAVVMIYTPLAFAIPDAPNYGEVIVHELPELPAGETVSAKFSAPIPDGAPQLTYFVQVFDHDGREIRSNVMDNAWLYYRLRDIMTLKSARQRYIDQFQGQDHRLVPVVMPKPLLPDDAGPAPKDAAAVLDVSADGTVTGIEFYNVDTQPYRDALGQALNGWLFLPELHEGIPVASRVQVPLKF